jgi:uncharacterized protein (DUF58 family)
MSRSRQDPDAILTRLEWTVIRRLDGLLHGNYNTLFRGFGLDLADMREYQFHDDVRHIDWNVTARLQTPYVREFHEDREITAWFLLDVSASVDFGSERARKRTVLTEFVGVLARLLTRNGNRVGAMLFNGDVERTIPPRGGRTQVVHILNALLSGEAPPGSQETDLGAFLSAAEHILRRRSLVFIVSDFISVPGWDAPLFRLTRRHEVLGVRLFDPLELELPDLGLIVMQDSETGEQLLVDTHDAGFRARFTRAAQERERTLRGALDSAGVDALELSTDGDLVDAILRFTDLRKHRSQLAAGDGLPTHLGLHP